MVYANECGYNPVFEGYVCKTFYDLLQTYSTDKDRFWIVESDEEIVGSIAVIGHPDKKPKFDGLSCIRITEEWVLERNLSKRQSRTAEKTNSNMSFWKRRMIKSGNFNVFKSWFHQNHRTRE